MQGKAHTELGFLAALVSASGCSSLCPKYCTLWEGCTLEQFMQNSSLWEGLILERFMENHFPWEGPLAAARKECEEEEVRETTCDELTVMPISHPSVQVEGGGKKHQE